MYGSLTVLVLIPARSGSKRIPHKNTKKLKGKPLIAYAIGAAKKARFVDRVVVTTDSGKIAAIARSFGAEAPFIRPRRLASDAAPMASTIAHALRWLRKEASWSPDIVVLVQPTSPLVKSTDIDAAVKTLVSKKTNSCVSVSSISERPEWMFTLKRGRLRQRYPSKIFVRSQDMRELYRLNGAVNASLPFVSLKKRLAYDPSSLSGIVMPRERSIDIDAPEDWANAERLV